MNIVWLDMRERVGEQLYLCIIVLSPLVRLNNIVTSHVLS